MDNVQPGAVSADGRYIHDGQAWRQLVDPALGTTGRSVLPERPAQENKGHAATSARRVLAAVAAVVVGLGLFSSYSPWELVGGNEAAELAVVMNDCSREARQAAGPEPVRSDAVGVNPFAHVTDLMTWLERASEVRTACVLSRGDYECGRDSRDVGCYPRGSIDMIQYWDGALQQS